MPEISAIERAKIILEKARKNPASSPEYQVPELLEVVALALIANAEQSQRIADQLKEMNDTFLNHAVGIRDRTTV